MKHTTNFYLCIRVTFLRKKSIKAQAGETSCDFRLDLSRPTNFLSVFVRFLRFFTWSSYFRDNFDEPWSSSCFYHWDEFCLPRQMEFISSLLSIRNAKVLIQNSDVFVCIAFIIKLRVMQAENIKKYSNSIGIIISFSYSRY